MTVLEFRELLDRFPDDAVVKLVYYENDWHNRECDPDERRVYWNQLDGLVVVDMSNWEID